VCPLAAKAGKNALRLQAFTRLKSSSEAPLNEFGIMRVADFLKIGVFPQTASQTQRDFQQGDNF
jgi:hypothetical protein